MRDIKFRAWDGSKMSAPFHWFSERITFDDCKSYKNIILCADNLQIMQFTGLLDKNGKEIYELMELDNLYRVIYDKCSYVLQDISTGDIIGLLDNSLRKADEREITGEYSPLA